jgi:hypothetical protein
VWLDGVDSAGSGYCPVVGLCKHSNKLLDSVRAETFLSWVTINLMIIQTIVYIYHFGVDLH